jgi:hypothetical protein
MTKTLILIVGLILLYLYWKHQQNKPEPEIFYDALETL